MSMNHAILGILSVQPMTGYDLKKVMQESSFLYWSGNNNQIYKALLALAAEGCVTSEQLHEEKAPSKKRYSITERGLRILRDWLKSDPEAPEYKNLFLVQLAWADLLDTSEILALFDCYEQRVEGQIAFAEGSARKKAFAPQRSPRESALWSLINENIIETGKSELRWIAAARKRLKPYEGAQGSYAKPQDNKKEATEMEYTIIENDKGRYLRLESTGARITRDRDGLDLIALCAQNDVRLLLIPSEAIGDEFLQLSTGVAGTILQKFTSYGIRAAAVLEDARIGERFGQLMLEMNKGNVFRVYPTTEAAEQWLIS